MSGVCQTAADIARDIHKTTGGKVETHPLDVTDLGAIGELPKVVQQKLGGIDLLVNNAGTGTYKPFLEVTDDELQYGMAINFFAQHLPARHSDDVEGWRRAHRKCVGRNPRHPAIDAWRVRAPISRTAPAY